MLIQKSFYTYQQQLALPGLRREQKVLIDRLSSPDLKLEQLELVTELHATQHSELTIRDELRSVLNEPIHCLPFLQVGRLTQVRMPCTSADEHAAVEPSPDWGWGIIVNFRRKPSGGEVAGRPTPKAQGGVRRQAGRQERQRGRRHRRLQRRRSHRCASAPPTTLLPQVRASRWSQARRRRRGVGGRRRRLGGSRGTSSRRRRTW